jgi:hypothetical protein
MALDTYTAKHARRRAADLEVVLADFGSVEHCVEGRNLVHLHRSHLQHFRCLVHRRQSQKVIVLFLGDKEGRDHSRRLVVVWVLGEELLNGCVAFRSELKRRFLEVVLSVAMVGESAEREALGCEQRALLEGNLLQLLQLGHHHSNGAEKF